MISYPCEYWTILPFFDHAIQFKPNSLLSPRFKVRIIFGVSAPAGFAMLQTCKSPCALCTANMSDLCFEDDACQAKPATGDGAFEVDKVWRMVNVGSSDTIRTEPFWYLDEG